MIDFFAQLKSEIAKDEASKFHTESKSLFKELCSDYKHKFSGNFVLINGSEIASSIHDQKLCVTRKMDGEMRTLFFDGQKSFMYTTGGNVETGFPCLQELTMHLKKAGIKSAGIVAELIFLDESGARTRVADVIHAIATKDLHSKLALAPFDIVFLDNKEWRSNDFEETYNKITEIFDTFENAKINNSLVQPVQMQKATTTKEVEEIYQNWVVNEKAEGLVIHSEESFLWKVKPFHTIDAVAVGYTTTEDGENSTLRDILFAVREANDSFRVFASGSNGLTNAQRTMLFSAFSKINVEADYMYLDSRGVVFQMIEPKHVFELGAIDFVSENIFHKVNYNDIILYDEKSGYKKQCVAPGVSTYFLSIIRERTDKTACFEDIRVNQISDIVPFAKASKINLDKSTYEPSTLIKRYVYKKTTSTSIFVKKFVLWKTNKEKTKKYPAYVLQFSYFSSRKANPLEKKIYVSSEQEQLEEKLKQILKKEIKGEWEYVY